MSGDVVPVPDAAVECLRRALLTVRVGARMNVTTIRAELEAMSVTGNVIGGAFRHAVRAGWLTPVGFVPCPDRSAKGRVIREYRREPIGPQGLGERPSRRDPVLFDLGGAA